MNKLKDVLMGADPVAVLRAMDENGTLADLDPAISGLRMEIRSGARHKDNLEHSIRVLGNAIAREKNGPDLVLRTAALLHDVGKPATRKFDGRGAVNFDGHEAVGAAIVKQMLGKHGYTKAQIREIALLVALHMRSHGSANWTDSAVRRLITDVGDETTMERLIVIFYADATTKHADKLERIHASTDALVAEMAKVKASDARKALRPALNGLEVMELLGLPNGRALGPVMRFLNSDEGVHLSREDAVREVLSRFGE